MALGSPNLIRGEGLYSSHLIVPNAHRSLVQDVSSQDQQEDLALTLRAYRHERDTSPAVVRATDRNRTRKNWTARGK